MMNTCDTCDGDGVIPVWPMWMCNGAEIAAGLHRQVMECPDCDGSGRIESETK